MKYLADGMKKMKRKGGAAFIKKSFPVLHHILLLGVSAALILSLPWAIGFIADQFLIYWSWVGNDKIFFISIEMGLTILLLLFTACLRKGWKDRKFSRMANAAGLVSVIPKSGPLAKRRTVALKEKQEYPRDVMVISSTGFRTFVDPGGELYPLLQNCQKARIMLLNPDSEGARVRAKSVPGREMTTEMLGGQIQKSIDFLKTLRNGQKNIKLKLYPDPPFLKMAVLGNYIWLQHYQTGFGGHSMPGYVFRHDPETGSLYLPFYQYFMVRWNNPDIPEYDFEADRLIYRNPAGQEVRRENLKTDPPWGNIFKEGNRLKTRVSSHLQALVAPIPAGDFPAPSCKDSPGGLHPGGRQFKMLRAGNPVCEAADWIALR